MKHIAIIQWTWGIIQTLFGLLLKLAVKPWTIKSIKHRGASLTITSLKWGISLGHFIIIGENRPIKTRDHEFGHCIQSAKLGPLYLPVVGLISISRNIYSIIVLHKILKWSIKRIIDWYYNGYPEKWADKLGGVTR